MEHILSLMIFVPLLGMVVILVLPRQQEELAKAFAAVFTFVPVVLGVQLYMTFDRTTAGMQFVEHYTWIEAFNIEYFLGVDGLSILMILLTALLSFIGVIASWNDQNARQSCFVASFR